MTAHEHLCNRTSEHKYAKCMCACGALLEADGTWTEHKHYCTISREHDGHTLCLCSCGATRTWDTDWARAVR